MYGTAESVRFITKTRKLLIKITKKKWSLGVGSNSGGMLTMVTT